MSDRIIEKRKKPLLVDSGLTMEDEAFCRNYVSKDFFGNGKSAYKDIHPNASDNTAKSEAYKLLRRPEITKRINKLLDAAGLNDEFVDKQLLFLITQNSDFPTKVAAIREYNKLRQRIIEKLDIISDGNPISSNVTYNVLITGKIKEE